MSISTTYSVPADKRLYCTPVGIPAKNRPGIIMAHGYNATGSPDNNQLYLPPQGAYTQVEKLAAYGFGLIGGDLGGDSTWGNATGVTAVGTYLTDLRTFAHPSKKIGLLGYSMGAMNVLNYARANPGNVAAIALQIPLVNGEDLRSNNRGGYQAVFETAWTNNAAWQAARATSNPVEYAASLASIPIMIHYSTNDPVVDISTIAAFVAAHGNTVTNSLGAVGHAITGIDVTQAADFFNKYLV